MYKIIARIRKVKLRLFCVIIYLEQIVLLFFHVLFILSPLA